jgi:uncharacterized heparinase superfamily protein
LYLDSFRRLSLKQQLLQLTGRTSKHFFALIPATLQRSFTGRLRVTNESDRDTPIVTNGPLLALLHRTDFGLDIPDSIKNTSATKHPYQRDLAHRISRHLAGDRAALWDKPEGDVEYACNRQRFYLFSGIFIEAAAAPDCYVHAMLAWIDMFPPAHNRAWDSFNCSLRLINWAKTLAPLAVVSTSDKSIRNKILGSIDVQARRMYSESKFEVPGNHVILTLFALWLVGTHVPQLRHAQRWRQYADRRLAQEIMAQFYSSGFHFEHSTHYHLQVTLTALYWAYGRQSEGAPVEKSIEHTLRRACSAVARMVLPDGSIAAFGDGGFSFFHASVQQDVRAINHLADRLFGSHPCATTTEVHDIYPYLFARYDSATLLADVGSIGLFENPGHGHADIASFVYASQGVPLMIDPGTKAYSNNEECLSLKRSSSHNTISIDGADHSYLWGFFRWGYLPDNPEYRVNQTVGGLTIETQYDGFWHIGGVHHRRVLRLTPRELTIIDSVRYAGARDVHLNFILHPDIEVRARDATSLTLQHGTRRWIVQFRCPHPWKLQVDPFNVYTSYGVSTSSHRISLTSARTLAPYESEVTVQSDVNSASC